MGEKKNKRCKNVYKKCSIVTKLKIIKRRKVNKEKKSFVATGQAKQQCRKILQLQKKAPFRSHIF